MSIENKELRILYVGLLCVFAVFGISMTIIGATLPGILADFSWSYTAAGSVIAATALGYFATAYAGGILLQRVSPKLIISVGLALQIAALFLFGRTASVALNFILCLFIGCGQGATEVTVNYCVVRIERKGQSHLMGIMHAAFSFGAVIGPLIIGLLIGAGLPWRIVFEGLGGIVLLLIAAILALPFKGLALERSEKKSHAGSKPERQPLFYLAFIVLFLYVGIELGTSNWISEYFVSTLHATVSAGAFMVSVYWLGIMIGRIVIPLAFRRLEHSLVLLWLSIGCALTLAASLMMRSVAAAGLSFFFAGLSCSAVYPLVMSIIGQNFPAEAQSRAVGFAATGGGLGSLLFPVVMSAVAESAGIRNGFVFYTLMAAAMTGASLAVYSRVRRSVRA